MTNPASCSRCSLPLGCLPTLASLGCKELVIQLKAQTMAFCSQELLLQKTLIISPQKYMLREPHPAEIPLSLWKCFSTPSVEGPSVPRCSEVGGTDPNPEPLPRDDPHPSRLPYMQLLSPFIPQKTRRIVEIMHKIAHLLPEIKM